MHEYVDVRGYFFPICHAKRLAIWAEWLDTTLLAPVPHRHVVLTIPTRRRAYCRYAGTVGASSARSPAWLQTHGSRANWHPHLQRRLDTLCVRSPQRRVSRAQYDTDRPVTPDHFGVELERRRADREIRPPARARTASIASIARCPRWPTTPLSGRPPFSSDSPPKARRYSIAGPAPYATSRS